MFAKHTILVEYQNPSLRIPSIPGRFGIGEYRVSMRLKMQILWVLTLYLLYIFKIEKIDIIIMLSVNWGLASEAN